MTYLYLVLASIFMLGSSNLDFKYHSNNELLEYLRNYEKRFPNIATVYSIGKSVTGIDLLVLRLTTTQDDLAPNVKFIGNTHGNEAITREILLHFAEYIGNSYTSNSTMKDLLNTTIIHILPSHNPDGFTKKQIGICTGTKGRNNANNVDLNRNFPDYTRKYNSIQQQETLAITKWIETTRFSLSASLHSGALIANYPFDSTLNLGNGESKTPDDDVFKHLALVYSNKHPVMHLGNLCKPNFPNGIVNGAKWYTFPGGMGDYNYMFGSTMELTLEINCCKFPMTKEIKKNWYENKEALVEFAFQANQGVRGIITDFNDFDKNEISLRIKERSILFYPDSKGRFWRILLPGTYILEILIHNSTTNQIPFVVHKSTVTLYPNLLGDNVFTTTENIIEENDMFSSFSTDLSEFTSDATISPSTNTILSSNIIFRNITRHNSINKANAVLFTDAIFYYLLISGFANIILKIIEF